MQSRTHLRAKHSRLPMRRRWCLARVSATLARRKLRSTCHSLLHAAVDRGMHAHVPLYKAKPLAAARGEEDDIALGALKWKPGKDPIDCGSDAAAAESVKDFDGGLGGAGGMGLPGKRRQC